MKILLSAGALGKSHQEVASLSKIIMTIFFVIILVPLVRRMLLPISRASRPLWGEGGAKLAARNEIHWVLRSLHLALSAT